MLLTNFCTTARNSVQRKCHKGAGTKMHKCLVAWEEILSVILFRDNYSFVAVPLSKILPTVRNLDVM